MSLGCIYNFKTQRCSAVPRCISYTLATSLGSTCSVRRSLRYDLVPIRGAQKSWLLLLLLALLLLSLLILQWLGHCFGRALVRDWQHLRQTWHRTHVSLMSFCGYRLLRVSCVCRHTLNNKRVHHQHRHRSLLKLEHVRRGCGQSKCPM